MNPDIAIEQAENMDGRRTAQRIVFFMAVLSTVLGVLYLIGLVGKIIVDGTVHSVSSPGIQAVSAVTAILLDLALLIMFVALRRLLSGRNVVFADLAVVFMILVCVTSSINWFVQLAVLPRVAGSGDATLLALIDVHNSGSVMYAIEHLGWGIFYGLAAIFLAVSFDKSERLLRWLLIAGGLLSILHVFGIITSNLTFGDLGYIAWGVLLPLTTAILAIRFKGSVTQQM